MIGPTFSAEVGQYMARVLADSVSPDGVRLTTVEARFPRFILAEVNTHRQFSRNSASSRAIPTEKLIDAVAEDPFVPATFNARVKGMGIGEEVDATIARHAADEWLKSGQAAVNSAIKLTELGLDKSRVNRLLEPFMWHTAIITATDWSNMLGLRCPPGDEPDKNFPAQWEFQQTAILIRDAMRASMPQKLDYGQWHLPLMTDDELAYLCKNRREGSEFLVKETIDDWKRIASRRVARVSFDKHTDTEPLSVSVSKTGELISSGHWSPLESVARPIERGDLVDGSLLQDKIMIPASIVSSALHSMSQSFVDNLPLGQLRCGNFQGWVQYRKEFAGEEDHSMLLDYEVM